MTDATQWAWYASDNAEIYTVGPEGSRDDIISAARNDELGFNTDEGKPVLTFWIVEARKADLRIADFCFPRDLFDEAEERLADSEYVDEFGNSNGAFNCTAEQKSDLRQRLRAACEQWQADHGLRWHSWAFVQSRNEETIVIPLDEPAGDA